MAGLHKLTPAFVARAQDGKISTARRYGDGGGLYLKVGASRRASWVFVYGQDGKQTLMGGGSVNDVSLKAARNWAAEQRQLRSNGADPLATRDRQRRDAASSRARGATFETAARRFIAAFEPSWRNPKHRQQWTNTLVTYVFPVFGAKSVAGVETADIVRALDPIWSKKPETASRVRGRIEQILDWAKAQGLRQGENPARWRGHLRLVFPPKAKVRRVKHHAAVAIDEIPDVWVNLSEGENAGALAAAFCIATALRPGVVRLLTWDEIDIERAVWKIPAEKMKAAREHRVPLSAETLDILERAKRWQRAGSLLVFPGGKRRAPLSLSALSKALKAAGGNGATVHGTARSTFSDWAHERTHHPNELVEMALAHAIKSKAEAAYRRGDLLEKRRELMAHWGRHLSGQA